MLVRRLWLATLLSLGVMGCSGDEGGPPGRVGPDSFRQVPGFDFVVNSMAPARDGSGDLYVGGMFTTYNLASANGIIRLNPNGTQDAAFVVGLGFNDSVWSVAAATDSSGDVYVGGDFTTYQGSSASKIIRLNSDGTPDATFVVGTGFDDIVHSIAVAADGSGDVYVGGEFITYKGLPAPGGIVRLNPDGTPDTAFVTGAGFDDIVWSVAPATDGSGDVYVGGGFTTYDLVGSAPGVIRLNPDGSQDAVFAVGTGITGGHVRSLATATDSSGDVYLGGEFTSYQGSAANRIIRLDPTGTKDVAFATGTGFAGGGVWGLAPAAGGSGDVFVVGGFTTYNSSGAIAIIRLRADGTPVLPFAVGTSFSFDATCVAPATDGSGDVFVGGMFATYDGVTVNYIARLATNGSAL